MDLLFLLSTFAHRRLDKLSECLCVCDGCIKMWRSLADCVLDIDGGLQPKCVGWGSCLYTVLD